MKSANQIRKLTECAVMLALAFGLSCITIFPAAFGGSLTPVSMLPILLIALKYGTKTGLSVSCLYAAAQGLQSLIKGNVFPYCTTFGVLLLCLLFDYLLPFGLLGLAGAFRRYGRAGEYSGIAAVILLRLACHTVSGVFVWGQWVDAFGETLVYSLGYNASYMIPELVLTLCAAAAILEPPAVRNAVMR